MSLLRQHLAGVQPAKANAFGSASTATLRDARQFIAKLPKREHSSPEWQAAIQALILVSKKAARRYASDRHHAGAPPSRRARVHRPERPSLGKGVAGARSVTKSSQEDSHFARITSS